MILGVDASNLRGGGGVTHLTELLSAVEPSRYGFHRVIVWGNQALLAQLPRRPWLETAYHPSLDRKLAARVWWQRRMLPVLARRASCALLFCPGGLVPVAFSPVVTMCRNLLPFEWSEMWQYRISRQFLRLRLLRRAQIASFRRADGLIFVTEHALERVRAVVGDFRGASVVISHGLGRQFFAQPQCLETKLSGKGSSRFRLLYVSIINVYKHQWHVAEAVARLRQEGWCIELDLVGPAYAPALRRLQSTLRRLDPGQSFIRYRGAVSYEELPRWYRRADLFVFASTCESFGNIILEAMAAGLPIACSDSGAMLEILGEAGIYFNPRDPGDLVRAIKELISSPQLRNEKARLAFERACGYSWDKCASETFSFLARIAGGYD